MIIIPGSSDEFMGEKGCFGLFWRDITAPIERAFGVAPVYDPFGSFPAA
jgi:hypothetical protein